MNAQKYLASDQSLLCSYCHQQTKDSLLECPECLGVIHETCWQHTHTCPAAGCHGMDFGVKEAEVQSDQQSPEAGSKDFEPMVALGDFAERLMSYGVTFVRRMEQPTEPKKPTSFRGKLKAMSLSLLKVLAYGLLFSMLVLYLSQSVGVALLAYGAFLGREFFLAILQ